MSVPQTPERPSTVRKENRGGCSCIIKDAAAFLYYFYFFPFKALPFLPLNKRELSYPVTVFQKTSSTRQMHYEYTATETSGVDSPNLTFVTSEVLNITSRNHKESCQSQTFRHLSVYSYFRETA